ncbi:MAG: toxic anion resistance protein [Parasporobacterium sp.]|nr:toxic anion resistance protein [Parasporobacterium sp.]
MAEEIKLELGVPELDGEDKAAEAAEEALAQVKEQLPPEEYMKEVNLTEEENQMVADFAEKIDVTDPAIVMAYGTAAQKKIAGFSEGALEGVRTKNLGEAGNLIAGLVAELKGFSTEEEEPKGILKWFKSKGNALVSLKARYDSAEQNVDKITTALTDHQNQLTEDAVMLNKMYDTNLTYFKELTMYIMAGKKRLEQERATTLEDLKAKAKASGLAEDAQAANDFAAMCDRFEKKLYDLELSRTVSMQMAPQIRLIQNSDMLMVEKITSTINNTIPLWKNQMVLALGMIHADDAMKAQREVSEVTNELLKKNAEQLRAGTTEIAAESEKGIVEIETVQYANEQLIASLDEVLQIQAEGREKRRLAEGQLATIEAELKSKLLEIEQKPLAEAGEVK